MLTSEIILSQLNFDKWRINLFWIGVLEEKQVSSKKVLILLIKIFIILMLNLSGKMPVNDAIRRPQIPETHLTYAWFHWAKSEVFPLVISSVNVIRSAGNFIFGYIYWRNPQDKTFFLPLDRQYVIYIIFEFRSSSSLVFHKKLILKTFCKTRKKVSALEPLYIKFTGLVCVTHKVKQTILVWKVNPFLMQVSVV